MSEIHVQYICFWGLSTVVPHCHCLFMWRLWVGTCEDVNLLLICCQSIFYDVLHAVFFLPSMAIVVIFLGHFSSSSSLLNVNLNVHKISNVNQQFGLLWLFYPPLNSALMCYMFFILNCIQKSTSLILYLTGGTGLCLCSVSLGEQGLLDSAEAPQ